jgi:hypothetical protein
MTDRDTNTPMDFAETLNRMVGPALIRGASDRQALLRARAAFDAGDIEAARLSVMTATVPTSGDGGGPDSIQWAVYTALPREGYATEGMG